LGLIDEQNPPWFFGCSIEEGDPCNNRPKYEGNQVFAPSSIECFWERCGDPYGHCQNLDSGDRCLEIGPTGFISVVFDDEAGAYVLRLDWWAYTAVGSAIVAVHLASYQAPITQVCGPATFAKRTGVTADEGYFPETIPAVRVDTPEACRTQGGACCDRWGDAFTLNAAPLGCVSATVAVTMTRVAVPGAKVWTGSGNFCGDTHVFVFRCNDRAGSECGQKFRLVVYPGCGSSAPVEAAITGCDCSTTPPTFTFTALRSAEDNAGCKCCLPQEDCDRCRAGLMFAEYTVAASGFDSCCTADFNGTYVVGDSVPGLNCSRVVYLDGTGPSDATRAVVLSIEEDGGVLYFRVQFLCTDTPGTSVLSWTVMAVYLGEIPDDDCLWGPWTPGLIYQAPSCSVAPESVYVQ
jgi:hypothetical protein